MHGIRALIESRSPWEEGDFRILSGDLVPFQGFWTRFLLPFTVLDPRFAPNLPLFTPFHPSLRQKAVILSQATALLIYL